MAGRTLRVGVVGAGGIAVSTHMPGWLAAPDCRIVAVADVDKRAVRAAAEKFDVPHAFTDPTKVVTMDELDIVDVCTPNQFHGPIGVAALRAGKHVIVEKPMTATAAQARELVAAARQAKRKLMCAQHQRFKPESVALAKYIAGGRLGEVYYARAQAIRRRGLPNRPGFICMNQSGGGPLLDVGVHILDLTWWLMGCPKPVSVFGMADKKLAGRKLYNPWGPWDPKQFDVEDFAVGMVRFANGGMLTLETSWLANTKHTPFGCELFGTRAGATWPACEISTEKRGTLLDVQLHLAKTDLEPHHEEIRQFADAVRRDRPVPVPPEQSLTVVEMLDGIYNSSRTGREVRVG